MLERIRQRMPVGASHPDSCERGERGRGVGGHDLCAVDALADAGAVQDDRDALIVRIRACRAMSRSS